RRLSIWARRGSARTGELLLRRRRRAQPSNSGRTDPDRRRLQAESLRHGPGRRRRRRRGGRLRPIGRRSAAAQFEALAVASFIRGELLKPARLGATALKRNASIEKGGRATLESEMEAGR